MSAPEFKFVVGQRVTVAQLKRDPGGDGVVTSRRYGQEESDPPSYRVRIEGNALQQKNIDGGGRAVNGFWYPESVVSARK